MRKKLIFICAALSLLITLSACGSGSSNENKKSTNKDDEKIEYTIDWNKCLKDLKESVLNQELYPYAKDIGVVVDDEQNRISISIVVSDDTSPEAALDYADTVVRQYNLMASTQDSSIASGSKDYYGGLYDHYDVLIGVAPQSKTGDKDAWFVSDAILSGAHNKIRLQNVSVDNANTQQTNMEPELEQTPTQEKDLRGRGWSDSGREEPQYVNVTGYVVIDYMDTKIKKSDGFKNTPWEVPVYSKDKQYYVESGTVNHKTEVIIKSQELEHSGYGAYSGYLIAERLDNGAEICIDVGNFITKPYWEYDSILSASLVGYFIAEFNQVSDYYPVTSGNSKADVDDGTLVLVTKPTGTYGRNGPDNKTNGIEAQVFKEWKNGYGGVSVFFNEDDLTIIY